MKKTALYEEHEALGAKMAPFGDWQMPIQYAGILAEHKHTREVASLFDISHMGEFEIRGASAARDLEMLLTQPVESLEIGQCRYGFMLDEAGGVIDDLTCYRLAEDRFYLVVNAATRDGDAEWIRNHISSATNMRDLSSATAKLDVQGPQSRVALEKVIGSELPDLKFFRITGFSMLGTECLLSRTGYTGEFGYEIYFPVEKAPCLWRSILKNPAIKPAGLGARDTLRLEMGFSLYGHELSREQSPVSTTGAMFIKKDTNYIGREIVERDLAKGPHRKLVALRLNTRRAARAGDTVLAGDRAVGEVTSGSFSPSLGVAIALAFVESGSLEAELEITVRGNRFPTERASLPFYKDGSVRRK